MWNNNKLKKKRKSMKREKKTLDNPEQSLRIITQVHMMSMSKSTSPKLVIKIQMKRE